MSAWAQFVLWSRRRRLRQIHAEALATLTMMRETRTGALKAVSVCDSGIIIAEAALKEIRKELAAVEDPQRMLDEALPKNETR